MSHPLKTLPSRLSFSIWDLVVATIYVAVAFRMPMDATRIFFVVAFTALPTALVLLFFTKFSARSRNDRAAKGERFILGVLYRTIMYSAITLVLTFLAMWSKATG